MNKGSARKLRATIHYRPTSQNIRFALPVEPTDQVCGWSELPVFVEIVEGLEVAYSEPPHVHPAE